MTDSIGFLAQSASACSVATATINAQADAAQYTTCSTFAGSFVVGSGATGDLTLDGPASVGGDITILNATALTSFTSHTIGQIGGNFHMEDLTVLSGLNLPLLTAVKTITFVGLKALSSFTFGSVTSASSITISNTFLDSLDGFDLSTVGTLQIDNNAHLTNFTSNVANITTTAVFDANGGTLNVQFPELIWAANLDFRNVEIVNIDKLQVVNGSLGFEETSLSIISAPNLTTVGKFSTGVGSLTFNQNVQLTNISMNALTSVGGAIQIANDTILNTISFPGLKDVGGAIDFSGNFTT